MAVLRVQGSALSNYAGIIGIDHDRPGKIGCMMVIYIVGVSGMD